MKFSKSFCLILICLINFACSEDDGTDLPGTTPPIEIDNYFPLVVGNTWDYTNTVMSPEQDDFVASETLSVVSFVELGPLEEYAFDSDNPQNSGPVISALDQGTLSKSGDQLIFNGDFEFEVEGFPSLEIGLENAAIYDLSATNGTVLFSESGSADETIQEVPITLDYEFETIMGETLNSYTVNGTTYNDVIHSQIILTLEIKAVVFLEITVLTEQEVVVIDNYFAKDIGMISSETEIRFDFIEIEQVPIPFEDLEFDVTQSLESYNVELE
jgi:hypothetical protein